MNVLETRDLVKSYRGRTVVNKVNLTVRSGEITGLLGPNGAGKTTTFYMMVGLIKPDSGQVLFDNKDITDLPMYLRARLGITYLPQEPSVFRKLTVSENIMAILETLKLSESARKERLKEL
ncbi:MAG: lipopolysaccharide ABC transporter ATP-binding protein, partial [Deltaproteobacteria bacterium]